MRWCWRVRVCADWDWKAGSASRCRRARCCPRWARVRLELRRERTMKTRSRRSANLITNLRGWLASLNALSCAVWAADASCPLPRMRSCAKSVFELDGLVADRGGKANHQGPHRGRIGRGRATRRHLGKRLLAARRRQLAGGRIEQFRVQTLVWVVRLEAN